MIETRDKIINGDTYTVTQLPARRALRLKAKLIKIFGPVLAQTFLVATEKASEQQQKSDLVKAVQLLGDSIDDSTLELVSMEILAGVRKNGVELTPTTIDLEFAGDMAGLYSVILFAIEVNYANFFQMIGIGLPSQDSQKPMDLQAENKRIFGRT